MVGRERPRRSTFYVSVSSPFEALLLVSPYRPCTSSGDLGIVTAVSNRGGCDCSSAPPPSTLDASLGWNERPFG